MDSASFTIQGLLFIPFILVMIVLIQLRGKFYFVDDFFTRIDQKFSSTKSKAILYTVCIFLALLWGFIISYIVFPVSDVDNAMSVAILYYFKYGINPYTNKIVPHIFISPDQTTTIWGTYNYGPVDLIIYAFGYFIFSPFLGQSWWLYGSNIILTIFIYLIIRNLIPAPETVKLLPFLFFFSWFLQDNAVLMCLFLAIAWFIHVKMDSKFKYPLVIIFITLGVLTKLFIAFILIGYFVYVFKKDFKEWIVNGFIGGMTALIVMFPFNIIAVIKSLFLFQMDLNIRNAYAIIQGGYPSYLDLLNLNWLFMPTAIPLVVVFLVLCEKYGKDQIEVKLANFSLMNMILLPSSSYAFFILPSFFILVRYYQNHLNRHTMQQTESDSQQDTQKIINSRTIINS